MTDEERLEQVKEFLQAERKSNQIERVIVADLVDDVLDDSGQPELMVSSLEELIHAAEAAIKKVRELTPPELANEGEVKRFMVAYSVRFYNGSTIVKDTDSVNAKAQIEEDLATDDLVDSCQDTAVDVEAIYEIDDKNQEVPGTREEFP